MADFNTASQFQTALFVRADIAFDDITQIDKFRLVSISAEVEAGIVVVVFVRADNPICAFFGGEIGIDFTFEVDRAERAPFAPNCSTIAAGLAIVSGDFTPASFSALMSLNSWSPRNSSRTSSPSFSPSTTMDLRVCSTGISGIQPKTL